jgi:hypothetical protein
MKKIKLKSLLKESKSSKQEIMMKKLKDKNWHYDFDMGAQYGHLVNLNNGISIFTPYDTDKDEEEYFTDNDKKAKWYIQVGDEYGKFDKSFWFNDLKSAFAKVSELKTKLANKK